MTIQDRDIRSETYVTEHVDRLPFNTPEKTDRYKTERYHGAIGLNWYTSDPTIQFLMRYYLTPDEYAWCEPHLRDIGELMGGPVAIRADQTDQAIRRASSATTGGDTRLATSTSPRARRRRSATSSSAVSDVRSSVSRRSARTSVSVRRNPRRATCSTRPRSA